MRWRFILFHFVLPFLCGIQAAAYAAPCVMHQQQTRAQQDMPHAMPMAKTEHTATQPENCATSAQRVADCLPQTTLPPLEFPVLALPPTFTPEAHLPAMPMRVALTWQTPALQSPLHISRRLRI